MKYGGTRIIEILKNKSQYILGDKVRNMKMDFNTGGTWRRVGQWTLMMKIYDFFVWLSLLVTPHNIV